MNINEESDQFSVIEFHSWAFRAMLQIFNATFANILLLPAKYERFIDQLRKINGTTVYCHSFYSGVNAVRIIRVLLAAMCKCIHFFFRYHRFVHNLYDVCVLKRRFSLSQTDYSTNIVYFSFALACCNVTLPSALRSLPLNACWTHCGCLSAAIVCT